MRLFIAIDLPEDIISYVAKIQASLNKDSAKSVISKSYHLTLKFLGEVDEINVNNVIECLNQVKFNKFKLTTSDIGVFRDWDNINVIWLGLKENLQLKSLHYDIEKSLSSFVFKKEFDFHPHITIARVSYVNDKEKLKENIESIETKEKTFDVDSFILYSSTLTQKGPIYNIIKEFKVS